MLPVEPKLGKMLILGAIFNCLDPIMTVVAGLSVRDPFLMPADKKDLAESAKAQFSAREYSDHLALVRAYEGWKEAEAQQAGYEYCWRNFLSSQTLRAIDSLRKQFCYLLKDIGLVDHNSETYSRWSHEEHLVRAVICAGLFPGVSSVVDGHLKMLGGYLEFFMKPELANTYLRLKGELEELIQKKLLDPMFDTQSHDELLSAVRLVISEDHCDGRFVFGRRATPAPKVKEATNSKSSAGVEAENFKNQLQSLLNRAGHEVPTYKTRQLKNNQFRSTVIFNGLDFVGQPCSNKKQAEKSAAAEALLWLKGDMHSSRDVASHMSVLLKKSNKKDKKTSSKRAKWS